MQAFFNFFGGAAKMATWFITAVIIPIVAWATIMRADIETLKKEIFAEQVSLAEHKKMYAEEQRGTATLLRELKYMIGRIEGKLDRR